MKKLNITKKQLILAGLLAFVITGASMVTPSYATDNYIQISPTKEDYELDPGKTYSGSVRVQNIGDNEFEYSMSAQPFVLSGENNSVSMGAKGENAVYFDISKWVTFSKDKGTLAPHTKETIEYTINVPSDAPAGGQYMGIVATLDNSMSNSSDSATIKTIAQVSDLIFAKVNGETNDCAKIINNNINTFMFEPPISATSLVEDCGNVHMYATYTLKVTPLFSDKAIYDNSEDPSSGAVLPESKRFSTTSWTKEQGAPLMGIYNVEHTVKIGKETSTIKKLVFIFPLWLIIIFILLIAAIVFWLVSRSRQRKESKRSSVNTPTKD